ncbi:hypothetical protein V8F33_013794 [Rhypophila sp. PSN 637]
MEPIAALGLAANVAQFVGYVSKLMSTAIEIAGSAEGADKHSLELNSIYNSLSAFSCNLCAHQPGGTTNAAGSTFTRDIRKFVAMRIPMVRRPQVDDNIRSIEQLAEECHALCGALLNVFKGFRVEWTTWRPAQSFLQALKTTWGSRKIKALEERLSRYQGVIALHFLPLLSEMQDCTLRSLDTLKDEAIRLRLDQESRFDELTKHLRDMPTTLPSILAASIKEEEDRRAEEQKSKAASQADGVEYGAAEDSAGRMLQDMAESARLTDDDLETIEKGVSALSMAETSLCDIAKEHTFLRTLNFPSRAFRHDAIHPAHEKTFRWALELGTPQHNTEQPNGLTDDHTLLMKWLRNGDGAF